MKSKATRERNLLHKFTEAAEQFARLSTVWLLVILVLSIFELVYNGVVHQFPKSFIGALGWSFLNDLFFWLKGLIYLFIVYIPLNVFSQKFARTVYSVFIILMAVIQLSLTSYFTTSLVPLGADLYGYSMKDIKQTVGASGGISFFEIIAFVFFVAGTITAIWYLAPRVKVKRYLTFALPVISFLVVVIGLQSFTGQPNFKSDFD
ncbi:MAG TPA: hypothetical protein VFE54_00055, partial [Mucilaginibacter sp.]|nr:hypothetical protein [Mucilaginibacter sp.]